MKINRPLSLAVVGTLAAGMLPILLAAPAEAAPASPVGLSAFDGTMTGPATSDPGTFDRPLYYRFDAAHGVSRNDLGPAGYATFTTVVRADAGAATWTAGGELESFGLATVIPGETFVSNNTTYTGANPLGSPAHDGDPILFAQYNGGGPGNPTCANNKFYVGGSWVFGSGTECANVNDSADQSAPVNGGAQRYTVTIKGDGTWTGSVVPLDADGDVVTSFVGAHDDQLFTGTLPGTASTVFAPVLRLRAGEGTGTPWTYDVSGTTLLTVPGTTHVVTGGDMSVDGSSGWALETRNGGTGSFVNGTGTPPLGTGSWYMKSNAIGDKKFLHMTKVDGVPLKGRPLTDLLGLSFSSYSAAATYSPYVNIPIHSAAIDANSNGIADGAEGFAGAATGNAILVYEPVVASNTWAVSDTIGTPAVWRMTKPVISGGSIPAFTYKTWNTWLGIFTDGIINPTFGDIQWVIGDTSSASWSGKSGWVDAIKVTTKTEAATYDLEEGLGSCPVSIDTPNKTLTLTADCTTDTTLTMHDGWSLDGAGHTITAIDPSTGSFTGPVLTNELVPAGARIDVTDVHIDGNLATGCSASLFGVKFDGAAGTFTHSTVSDIRYGAGSGCQSGNSVDVTNLGGATRLAVTIDDVQVTGFQKTGIRANGNVALHLTSSSVASSDLDMITASNSLQISRGARAYVSGNTFGGNDWDGNGDWSATGVLFYGADDVTFTRNVVNGTDTDFGVYVSEAPGYEAGRATLTCNLVERDAAADSTPAVGALDLWNTGIAADDTLLAKVDATGNTVRGFATPYENVADETGGPCASGPVTDLAVAGATTSVTATWDAPAAADFAPVTAYNVTLIPGGATQTVTSTTAMFSGLTPASEYTVTVVPVNAAGAGTPASATGTTGPGAATITQTGTTETSATAAWSVLGTAYTAFHVVIEDADGVVATKNTNGDARTWTFSGLDPATDYTITVTPRIGGTDGVADSADVTTNPDTSTPPTAPGPVTALVLGGSGTTLTATWTAAPDATDYEATLIPGGQVQSVTGTTASFTVVAGKEYTVTVVPHNAAGWGPGRSASLDTALPTAPTGLGAAGSTTYAALTWTPSSAPSPVTSYTIVATPTSGPPVTTTVSAAGLTFPVKVYGLARNMTYSFGVSAANAFGSGPSANKSLKGTRTVATITPGGVTYGQKITVTGKVTDVDTGKPVAGQRIYLWARVKGGTTYVSLGGRATSATNGTFTFSYTPSASRTYFATSRGTDRMGASSATTYVWLRGTVSMALSKSSVKAGTPVTFSGTVHPRTGATVSLQRHEGSTWVTKRTATPSSSTGAYSMSWTPGSTTDYTWRVVVSGPTFSSGASPSKVLVVT